MKTKDLAILIPICTVFLIASVTELDLIPVTSILLGFSVYYIGWRKVIVTRLFLSTISLWSMFDKLVFLNTLIDYGFIYPTLFVYGMHFSFVFLGYEMSRNWTKI